MSSPRRISHFGPPPPLTDQEWAHAKLVLDSPAQRRGRRCIDERRSFEGIRWVASTGKPWADLPPEFGKAASVKRYYARLKHRDVFERLLNANPKRVLMTELAVAALDTLPNQLACLRNLLERKPRGQAATRAAS